MFSARVPFCCQPNGDPYFAPAHPDYINIGRLETSNQYIYLIAEHARNDFTVEEKFFGQVQSQAEFDIIKKEFLERFLQSVVVSIDKKEHRIEVEQGEYASCGLYCLVNQSEVIFHWDPTELYSYIPDHSNFLNFEACQEFLDLTWRYSPTTVFKDIYLIPARAHVMVTPGKMDIHRPQNIAPLERQILHEHIHVPETMIDLVKSAILRWNPDGEFTGTQLSSGRDTTLIAEILSRYVMPKQLSSFGYVPMGDNRYAIKNRRDETIKKLNLRDYDLMPENYIQTAFSVSTELLRYWPYQSPASALTDAMARSAAQADMKLIYTGVGGDELCLPSLTEMSPPSQAAFKQVDPLGSFSLIPIETKRQLKDKNQEIWPAGLVSESINSMANASSFIWVRAGVWNAHPLGQLDVQTFAHFLPIEWSKNRKLSHDMLVYFGYSKYFLSQTPPEDFSPILVNTIKAVDWDKRFSDSPLVDYGLIDPDLIKTAWQRFNQTEHPTLLMKLLTAVSLDLGVRSALMRRRLTKSSVNI